MPCGIHFQTSYSDMFSLINEPYFITYTSRKSSPYKCCYTGIGTCRCQNWNNCHHGDTDYWRIQHLQIRQRVIARARTQTPLACFRACVRACVSACVRADTCLRADVCVRALVCVSEWIRAFISAFLWLRVCACACVLVQ